MRIRQLYPNRVVHHVSNLSSNTLFHLGNQLVHYINAELAYQNQFNGARVYSRSVVAHHVGLFQVTHSFQEVFNQLIKTQILGNQGHQIRIKWIRVVYAVLYLLTVGHALEQTGFFHVLQFQADGIGGVAKFLGQAAQMTHRIWSAEKLQQEL